METARMIPMIPPSTAKKVISALSEMVDWGQTFTHVGEYRDTNKTMGEGVNVAVLDTGIPEHPDLKGNLVSSVDFTGDTRAFHPHSCHVAGIIAADADGVGVVGVAPKAKLHSVRVLDADGLCPSDYSFVISGLEWVLDHPEIDIVNLSLGAPIQPPDQMHTLISELANRGVIIVVASGNEGAKDLDYPAKYPETISVAAMDKDGKITNFSNVGDGLKVMAPGVDIYSTWVNGGYGYCIESGSSMAAPFISGLLALMLTYHRNGGDHDTPLTSYMSAISHLQTFQSGMLVSGLKSCQVDSQCIGVGIVNAAPILARYKTASVLATAAETIPNWRMRLYGAIDGVFRKIILGAR